MKAAKSITIDTQLITLVQKYMTEKQIESESIAFQNLIHEGLKKHGYQLENDGVNNK